MKILIKWLLMTASIMITAYLLPGSFGSELRDSTGDGPGARAHQCRAAAHPGCADLSFHHYHPGALHPCPERSARAPDERHRDRVFRREYLVGHAFQHCLFSNKLCPPSDLHLKCFMMRDVMALICRPLSFKDLLDLKRHKRR